MMEIIIVILSKYDYNQLSKMITTSSVRRCTKTIRRWILFSTQTQRPVEKTNLEVLYEESRKSKTPFFTTHSHHIEIIDDPLEFYVQLHSHIKKSVSRIGLSSLYLGTGTLERNLFKRIVKRIKDVPTLEACMVFDYHRSSRPEKGESSIRMMDYYLNQEARSRIKLGFHQQSSSPLHLLGEIQGVHHQKIALFDDTIIVGGANLSHNYFLNRKDRYLKFKEIPDLTDYFYDYLQVICENSHQFTPGATQPITPHHPNLIKHYRMWKFASMPPQYKDTLREQEAYLSQIESEKRGEIRRTLKKESKQQIPKNRNLIISEALGSDVEVYQQVSREELQKMRDDTRERLFSTAHEDDVANHLIAIEDIQAGNSVAQIGEKVYIFPFIQNPKFFNESADSEATEHVLRNSVQSNFPIRISSGYMNFTQSILSILAHASNPTQVLCSAPEANSFYHAGKFKKYIPYFYRCFEGKILEQFTGKFRVKQFFDGKWSFHAKGIWIKENQNKYLTAVGSSNFNRRSKERDSQLELFVYSTCPSLNSRLDAEWNEIGKNCRQISLKEIKEDRDTKCNMVSRLFSKLFSSYL